MQPVFSSKRGFQQLLNNVIILRYGYGVKIDFSITYDVAEVSEDLKTLTFETQLQDDTSVPLRVEISNESHELLPNFFNLALGQLKSSILNISL